MCSFIFSTKKELSPEVLGRANFYPQLRGPDKTNVVNLSGLVFLHNLLSITGDFTIQPFVDNDVICLYNGEIYNYKDFGDYKSDGECLISLYRKHSFDFVKKLDGEFAMVLVDLTQRKVLFSTDTFKTKPIFYSTGLGNLGCASYSSGLAGLGHKNVQKMEPNTAKVFDLDLMMEIKSFKVREFDLNQHKDNFDDWRKAFKKSIEKRTYNLRERIFIGLSSGYDSGAIACELIKQDVPFKAYTVMGTEDRNIIEQRKLLLKENTEFQELFRHPKELSDAHQYIEKNTEEFKYVTYSNSSDYNEFYLSLIDDNGANSLSLLCNHAIVDGKKILLSGMGADELFSDYGFNGIKKYNHSNFGGLFPPNLETIFPWPSFFNSSMESYLAKEEYVAGAYGIETRYPFLDVDVVQEFLWLKPELKNRYYKSVLHDYLSHNSYPFKEGEKIGF